MLLADLILHLLLVLLILLELLLDELLRRLVLFLQRREVLVRNGNVVAGRGRRAVRLLANVVEGAVVVATASSFASAAASSRPTTAPTASLSVAAVVLASACTAAAVIVLVPAAAASSSSPVAALPSEVVRVARVSDRGLVILHVFPLVRLVWEETLVLILLRVLVFYAEDDFLADDAVELDLLVCWHGLPVLYLT